MEDFFAKKKNACTIAIIFIFVIAALNFVRSYEAVFNKEHNDLTITSMDNLAINIERDINNSFVGKATFLEAFGYIQLLMGKSEQSNFETIKDTKGLLHTVNFSSEGMDLSYTADSVKLFKDRIADKNVKFLYALTPNKYIAGQTAFPDGMLSNNLNQAVDEFLSQLKSYNIDTLDYRQNIIVSGMSYDEMFYATDKHWTIESCFWAFTILADTLSNSYGLSIDNQNFFTNVENYNIATYPNSYIGSLGRKTGKYYSGVDDFTIIFPKFKTDIDISYGNSYTYENQMAGLFEDVFISALALRGYDDLYAPEADKYFSYKPNNYGIYHIKNRLLDDSAPKIAFIKNSMLNPVISFMSTICSDIYVIEPTLYDGDMLSFINSIQIDLVLISLDLESSPELTP